MVGKKLFVRMKNGVITTRINWMIAIMVILDTVAVMLMLQRAVVRRRGRRGRSVRSMISRVYTISFFVIFSTFLFGSVVYAQSTWDKLSLKGLVGALVEGNRRGTYSACGHYSLFCVWSMALLFTCGR